MWRFITHTLGPLTSSDPPTETLRETLAAYLSHGCNAVTTARHLQLHRNTISYRLDKIKNLLGENFIHRSLEISVALELTDQVGLPPHAFTTDDRGLAGADAPASRVKLSSAN
jgi:DNA-binding PucR family transcriptional regulator